MANALNIFGKNHRTIYCIIYAHFCWCRVLILCGIGFFYSGCVNYRDDCVNHRDDAEIWRSHDLIEAINVQTVNVSMLSEGSQLAQDNQYQFSKSTGLPIEVIALRSQIILRLIPPGSMSGESMWGTPEKCQAFTVGLDHGLYVAREEVTVGEWQRIMIELPRPDKNTSSDHPVQYISRDDAKEFFRRLNLLEGVPQGTYRLLQDAEWEYCCRAGTITRSYAADLRHNNLQTDANGKMVVLGWFFENTVTNYRRMTDLEFGGLGTYERPDPELVTGGPRPVGLTLPNAYGLFDMYGNVYEWVSDPWDAVNSDELGVIRGGGWFWDASYCMSSDRGAAGTAERIIGTGLRVARVLPGSTNGRVLEDY